MDDLFPFTNSSLLPNNLPSYTNSSIYRMTTHMIREALETNLIYKIDKVRLFSVLCYFKLKYAESDFFQYLILLQLQEIISL